MFGCSSLCCDDAPLLLRRTVAAAAHRYRLSVDHKEPAVRVLVIFRVERNGTYQQTTEINKLPFTQAITRDTKWSSWLMSDVQLEIHNTRRRAGE